MNLYFLDDAGEAFRMPPARADQLLVAVIPSVANALFRHAAMGDEAGGERLMLVLFCHLEEFEEELSNTTGGRHPLEADST